MRSSAFALIALVTSCQGTQPKTESNVIPSVPPAPEPSSSVSSPVRASLPPKVAPPPRGEVTCTFEGPLAIRAGERLLLGESSDVEAKFTGHRVHVRLERIDTAKGPVATAIVRAPSSSPALRLDAKLRLDAVSLRAARDIRVAGDLVTIPRGTPLVVASGEERALGVKPRYGDFGGVTAAASCDDVELGEASLQRSAARHGSPMHVTGKRMTLFVAPDGETIADLETRHERPTVDVVESRGAFRRVRYDDGLRIDAWVRASELAPGEGADCDDCHGAVMDVEDACPAPKGCPDEKGGPFHASHKVAVRDRPSPQGQAVGWLEEDGEVRIVGRQGSYARIEARGGEIRAPEKGLWVDEAILRPHGK